MSRRFFGGADHGRDEAVAGCPDDIRALGWAVAVHNDYRLNGEPHTFWLFTKDGRAIKGEGRSDAEALDQVRASLSPAHDLHLHPPKGRAQPASSPAGGDVREAVARIIDPSSWEARDHAYTMQVGEFRRFADRAIENSLDTADRVLAALSPSTSAAEPVAVKPLRWVKSRSCKDDRQANTDLGQYCVGIVHGSYVALRRCVHDGQLHDDVLARGLGFEDAKAVCQSDYEQRIRSIFAPPAPAAVDGQRVKELDEIETLINEYDPKNSDWYFRRTVIREVLSRIRACPATDKEDGAC